MSSRTSVNRSGPHRGLASLRAFGSARRLVIAFAGASLAFSLSAPAQAIDLPVQGTGRGGPFRVVCNNNGFMVGIQGRAGAWVDHFLITCATWNPAERRFTNYRSVNRQIGNSIGGGQQSVDCDSNTWVVNRMDFVETRGNGPANVVHSIYLGCSAVVGTGSGSYQFGSSTQPECRNCINPREQVCPAGEAAVGLHGRYGTYVDALGLIYAPFPFNTAAPAAANPATCKSGFVWRVAGPNDLVCVPPESRTRAAQDNKTAAQRVQPGGGSHGPNTCLPGFVWRVAFEGDLVCVTPQIRALVHEENRLGPGRRVGP